MEQFQEFFSDEPPDGPMYPVVPDDFDWAAATPEERAWADRETLDAIFVAVGPEAEPVIRELLFGRVSRAGYFGIAAAPTPELARLFGRSASIRWAETQSRPMVNCVVEDGGDLLVLIAITPSLADHEERATVMRSWIDGGLPFVLLRQGASASELGAALGAVRESLRRDGKVPIGAITRHLHASDIVEQTGPRLARLARLLRCIESVDAAPIPGFGPGPVTYVKIAADDGDAEE
jgi:hypothetical protein